MRHREQVGAGRLHASLASLHGVRRTGAGGQDVRLTFDTVPGARYLIQSAPDLYSARVTQQTNILASPTSTMNVVPGAGGADESFFRVGVDANP